MSETIFAKKIESFLKLTYQSTKKRNNRYLKKYLRHNRTDAFKVALFLHFYTTRYCHDPVKQYGLFYKFQNLRIL